MTKVQTMEAFRRPIVCEWSVTAKNRVLPYMTRSSRAAQAARIRLIFSMEGAPFRNIFTMSTDCSVLRAFTILASLYRETAKKSNPSSLKIVENSI